MKITDRRKMGVNISRTIRTGEIVTLVLIARTIRTARTCVLITLISNFNVKLNLRTGVNWRLSVNPSVRKASIKAGKDYLRTVRTPSLYRRLSGRVEYIGVCIQRISIGILSVRLAVPVRRILKHILNNMRGFAIERTAK